MIIRQLSQYNCKDKLREFIEELFYNWKQESSFSRENICCPNRPISEIMSKIDLADGNVSEFVVAFDEKSENILGMLYIAFNPNNSAHISLVNVNPKYRRNKVGFLLFSYSVALAVKKGVDCIVLETWNGNDGAIAPFEKFGFFSTSVNENTIEFKTHLPGLLKDIYSCPLDYSMFNSDNFKVELIDEECCIIMNYFNEDKEYRDYKIIK